MWRAAGSDSTRYLVIARYQGPELPSTLTDPVVDSIGTAGSRDSGWRLDCAEGRFDFRAPAVDWLEECPGLYQPLHRPFSLKASDRVAVRILLWLLRLPGGARWLRNWHAHRR
jgi:hypothetical protein